MRPIKEKLFLCSVERGNRYCGGVLECVMPQSHTQALPFCLICEKNLPAIVHQFGDVRSIVCQVSAVLPVT